MANWWCKRRRDLLWSLLLQREDVAGAADKFRLVLLGWRRERGWLTVQLLLSLRLLLRRQLPGLRLCSDDVVQDALEEDAGAVLLEDLIAHVAILQHRR